MSNPWFPYVLDQPETQIRLFCFPHSGGTASMYRNWQSHFPSYIQIVPVQLPGREGRIHEPVITSMNDLIEHLIPLMMPYLDKPFILFGHSLGALISYELSVHLPSSSSPLYLMISACSSPHLLQSTTNLHKLSDEKLIKALEKYQATSQKILQHKELMSILLRQIRADFTIFETYQYSHQKTLNIPIIALGGMEDDLVPLENLLAWKTQTMSSFQVECFEGGHFYISSKTTELCRYIVNVISHSVKPSLINSQETL